MAVREHKDSESLLPATPLKLRWNPGDESDYSAESPQCRPLARPCEPDFTDAYLRAVVARFQYDNPPGCDIIKALCLTHGFDPAVHWGLIPRGWGGFKFKFAIQEADLLIINLMSGNRHSGASVELTDILGAWITNNNLKRCIQRGVELDLFLPGTGKKCVPDICLLGADSTGNPIPILMAEVDVSNCSPTELRTKHAEYFCFPTVQGVLVVKIFQDDWGAAAVLWMRGADGHPHVEAAWIFGRHSPGVTGIRPAMQHKFEEVLLDHVAPAPGLAPSPLPPVTHWETSAPPTPIVDYDDVSPEVPFTPLPVVVIPAGVLLRPAVTCANAPVMAALHPHDLTIDLSRLLRAAILMCHDRTSLPRDVFRILPALEDRA
eukprot:m.11719 g.11719  ORF g.11719 m.11719 type:complete len:376 (-) comp2653_c0_seq1:72-1199(-)